MPALVMFGRRWSIATDDFAHPSRMDACIRISWLIATITVYFVDVHNLDDCSHANYIKIYFYGHLALIPLICVLDGWLRVESLSGGVMDIEMRRRVPLILYLRILGELMSLGWNIAGSIWFWQDPFGCSGVPNFNLRYRIRCYLVMNMMSAIFFGLCWALIFDPLGREYLKIKEPQEIVGHISELTDSRRARYWERRLRIWYWRFPYAPCLKNKSVREGFKEVGKIMAHFVQDYDLVLTDFLAGLIVLPELKLRLEDYDSCSKHYPSEPIPNSKSPFYYVADPNKEPERVYFKKCDPLDPQEISRLRHYHKYGGIIYGWSEFVMGTGGFPLKAHRLIWKHMLWAANWRLRPDGAKIEGDNSWHRNTASLKKMMEMKHMKKIDLIYASFHNDFYQSPFCLTVDHRYKSYVITVRGSASDMDIFTNLTAWPVSTDIPWLPKTFLVHHGFLMSARNAYGKVQKHLKEIRELYPEYKLVLTGFSMGGAIATVLGMILRSEYPDLNVYAFSPPGGILNLESSTWASSFTTTIVHYSDLIPRLSLYSLDKYIAQMITAIHECKTHKYDIIDPRPRSCTSYSYGHHRLKFKSEDKNIVSNRDDGIRIEGPIPELTYSSPKDRVSIPIMVLPGRILNAWLINDNKDEIFKPENPAAYLRIWTYTPIWKQSWSHSSDHLYVALNKFKKIKKSGSGPVLGPGDSESSESEPEFHENIV